MPWWGYNTDPQKIKHSGFLPSVLPFFIAILRCPRSSSPIRSWSDGPLTTTLSETIFLLLSRFLCVSGYQISEIERWVEKRGGEQRELSFFASRWCLPHICKYLLNLNVHPRRKWSTLPPFSSGALEYSAHARFLLLFTFLAFFLFFTLE